MAQKIEYRCPKCAFAKQAIWSDKIICEECGSSMKPHIDGCSWLILFAILGFVLFVVGPCAVNFTRVLINPPPSRPKEITRGELERIIRIHDKQIERDRERERRQERIPLR